MKNEILLLTVLAGAALPAFGQETDQAIHDELRGVLTQIETAINSGDYDKMLPVLSERIRATPIDQEFLASRPDVSAYFVKWFGPGGRLKKLDIHLAADAKTELSADKTWGTVWGQGVEKYILSDGRNFDFKTRWTATVAKEDDGRWRIRSIHIGTNFLDNPILNQAESALSKAAVGGGLGGLIVGGLLGWFVARKKKS